MTDKPRTFKLTAPPMSGDDIKQGQREIREQFEGMGIDYPLDADGVYGAATRDAYERLCTAQGILHEKAMADGVTPALRSKLRDRDRLTATERKRMEGAKAVDYRRLLRKRYGESGGLADTYEGSPIPGLPAHRPDHETAGLPGFPGYDYMAPAGSPCVSPVTGEVVRLSGHDPANGPTGGPHGPFGWSVYIEGGGKTYYLTHLGTRTVKDGQRVKQGEKIGTVGNYSRWTGTPNHIHMGVKS